MDNVLGKDTPEVLARIDEGLSLIETLVWSMWRQLGSPQLPMDDLKAAARETLVVTARTYDPDKGVPFRKWATLRMRGAMLDAARQTNALPKRVYRQLKAMQAADRIHETATEEQAASPPRSAEEADAKLSEQLASAATAAAIGFLAMRGSSAMETVADSEPSPESNTSAAMLMQKIRGHMAELPDQERLVIERIYFGEESLEKVAQGLGLSKSWASRIHSRAIESIAVKLRK